MRKIGIKILDKEKFIFSVEQHDCRAEINEEKGAQIAPSAIKVVKTVENVRKGKRAAVERQKKTRGREL